MVTDVYVVRRVHMRKLQNEKTKKKRLHELIDRLNPQQIEKLIELIRGILGEGI